METQIKDEIALCSKSFARMMRIDETGKRYGRLVVVEVMHRSLASQFKRAKAKWSCVCDCGERTAVFGDKLRSGAIKQCLTCERAWRVK